MFVRIVIVHAQEERLADALDYSSRRVAEVVARMGARLHQVLQGMDDPTTIAHVIGFDTREQLDAYWESPELAELAEHGFQIWGDTDKLRYAAKFRSIGGMEPDRRMSAGTGR
jgi:uncharacterized protein (DUF1330 family)